MAFEWLSKLNIKYMLDKVKAYIDGKISSLNSDLANKVNKSGDTMSGRLTANGKISIPTSGGSWISQKDTSKAPIQIITNAVTDGSRYDSIIAGKSTDGSTWNIGVMNNTIYIGRFAPNQTGNSFTNVFEIPLTVSANAGQAIKNITRNGTTFTATRANGTTFTFTQQDNNTWRGCQNNLNSTATDQSLSAYQGKVLNESKVGSGDVSGSFYKVSTLYTFQNSNNCLVQGSKGNYIWAITSWSDIRLKKNIKDSRVNALELINKIQMREFDFNDEKFGTHKDIGYVAQELMEVIPECVEEVKLPDEDKKKYGVKSMYQVEDKHMIPYLVKAIQEQQRQIEELKAEVEKLKDVIEFWQ